MSTTSIHEATGKRNNPNPEPQPSGLDVAAALEVLPANIAWGMIGWAAEIGMAPKDLNEGLRAAGELTLQRRHRCGVCYRWVERGKDAMLPVISVWRRRFHVGVCCERCERRYPGDELPAKIFPYLSGESGEGGGQ